MRKELQNQLKKYCIKDIIDLENLLVGKKVSIAVPDPEINPPGEVILVYSPLIDLNLVKVDTTIFKTPEESKEFQDFALIIGQKGYSIIQKLNYEDFIYEPNLFFELVETTLALLEEQIVTEIELCIENHFNNPDSLKGIIELVIYRRIKEANKRIIKRFSDETTYNYPGLNGLKQNVHISEAMKIVKHRQKQFLQKLEKDYGLYISNSSINNNPIISDEKDIPHFFSNKSSYNNFLKFINKFEETSLSNLYTNYSFIFQKMKTESYMHHIPHKEFFEWLSKRELINDELFNYFLERNGLKTLGKSTAKWRVQLFNEIFYN